MIINVKSIDKPTMVLYSKLVEKLFINLNINNKTYILQNMPTTTKKITLLKSPHVNKKAWEQFQIRTYKMIIVVSNTNNIKDVLKVLIINKPKNLKISFCTK
jgi:ribosomal protein S10